jgi:4-aminobutyrate aminotransferase-like enzyme
MSMAAATIARTRACESTAVNTFGLSEEPPVFVRGEGAVLWDQMGRDYLDLVCGSSVTNLGHGNERIATALRTALETGILHTGTRLPSPPRAALYEALSSIVPKELDAVHLLNSGAEAVETALKAAQYATGRNEVIAFFGGYHGRTQGALAVTAAKRARSRFQPFGLPVHFMPYPYALRPPLPVEDAEGLGEACLGYIRNALANPFSGISASAMIVEAVQGVAGVVIPPIGFIKGLRDICDDHGVVLIVDEIWNGFGRCGSWFAFERDGVVPDMVVFGKAVSGSLPLAGVLAKSHFLKKWEPGTHTSTFQGNPLSCAAAVANISELRDKGLIERARTAIAPSLEAFGQRIRSYGGVADVRVIGAQAGIELVGAKGEPAPERVKAVQRHCLQAGVLVYGGGWHSNVLMLVPPLVITEAQLDQAFQAVAAALDACE